MMSARLTAQFGLGAACLMLVGSITVLVAGASDPSNSKPIGSGISSSSQVTPLATGPLDSFQVDLAHVAITKR